jgi:3'-phosphoadenosine 5'-phosphosulfate (PAPS) 3'-phosphatase
VKGCPNKREEQEEAEQISITHCPSKQQQTAILIISLDTHHQTYHHLLLGLAQQETRIISSSVQKFCIKYHHNVIYSKSTHE